jgi:hypothetical protein
MERILRKTSLGGAALAVAAAIVAIGAAPAAANGHGHGHGHGQNTCSGTFDSPGTLVGTISGNLTVNGACAVDAGPAVVTGDLKVSPGSTLVAAFGSGGSNLTVGGNLRVKKGATAVLGCNPVSSPCADDDPDNPTLTSSDAIQGNLIASQALGVIVHNTTIGGNFEEHGGGGGFTCDTSPGVFALFQSPVFSALEDSSVGGNVSVSNVASCWMGMARVDVGGNASYIHNRLADPDAIEIVLNTIHGNLSCQGNSMTWDSGEVGEDLFPRTPQPNTVLGKRHGQCVLSSPMTEGGPLGPGPF